MGNVRSEQTALFFYVRWLAAHVLSPAAWGSSSMSTVQSWTESSLVPGNVALFRERSRTACGPWAWQARRLCPGEPQRVNRPSPQTDSEVAGRQQLSRPD